MLIRLFILFAVIPVVELYLVIKVGSLIGALPTVALLLAISMAGAWLVRHQGFEIMRRIQAELAQGRLPAAELLDGALVLVGGVLLLTPGFFTDLLGLFFLIPFTRAIIKQFAGLWLQRRLERGVITIRRV
ncbi:MAG TPA: FxsA family protein [Geobacteraceae bacterium]|nr:FxsA family protein [Geobacteraceae bacterium]